MGVFGQDALRVVGLGMAPGLRAPLEFGLGDAQLELAAFGVDGDFVAVVNHGQWAAVIGLGGDMANHEAVCATGETAIGDERHVVAEAGAHDGGSRAEHLSHTGTAARAFVADDDDVAFLDVTGEDGPHGFFLGVKWARSASEDQSLLASDFGHGALGSEVAVKDHEVAVFLDGLLE